MKGRTVIAVAHRLSTLRNANKIVVIKNGIVAGNGTHQQLLHLNGIYAELHHLQFGGTQIGSPLTDRTSRWRDTNPPLVTGLSHGPNDSVVSRVDARVNSAVVVWWS